MTTTTTTSVSSETLTGWRESCRVNHDGVGGIKWRERERGERESERERERETGDQKGKEKIRSLIKVVCASTRNVRGAVRETFKPDDGSKDTPADLKFPQRPLRNNVTTAVYRTADPRASRSLSSNSPVAIFATGPCPYFEFLCRNTAFTISTFGRKDDYQRFERPWYRIKK